LTLEAEHLQTAYSSGPNWRERFRGNVRADSVFEPSPYGIDRQTDRQADGRTTGKNRDAAY